MMETHVDTVLNVISMMPIFQGLSTTELGVIREIVVERRYTKGEVIFQEGDEGDGFYVVVAGRVKIFKLSSEGKEQILHIFDPHELFGEVPVFSGRSFPANAEAIEASDLLFFPRAAFVSLISGQPSLALNMLSVLSQRLRYFTVQIEHLSLKEVPERLAAYLVYLAGEQGREDVIDLPISKGQLASLLGTIPETLSRIFAKMSRQELIRVEGNRIALLDLTGLEILAGHEGRMD